MTQLIGFDDGVVDGKSLADFYFGKEMTLDGFDERTANKIFDNLTFIETARNIDWLEKLPLLDLKQICDEELPQYSVKINSEYRIEFAWEPLGVSDVRLLAVGPGDDGILEESS